MDKKLKEFSEIFEEKILPIIIGNDGKGIDRLKVAVERKRKDVEERKQRRLKNKY